METDGWKVERIKNDLLKQINYVVIVRPCGPTHLVSNGYWFIDWVQVNLSVGLPLNIKHLYGPNWMMLVLRSKR